MYLDISTDSGLNFKYFPSFSESNRHLPPAAHSSVLDLKLSGSYKNPAVPFDVTENGAKDWSWLLLIQFCHTENQTTRAETPIFFIEGN